ncbi:MAG TPA: 4'-phosphopantetheinyl transferase superfamily protein [Pyrinomonadaceae bacterium]
MRGFDSAWPAQPVVPPPLNDDDVHVWRFRLDQTGAEMERLRTILDRDEMIKAERFHFTRDRQHFIVAHGISRSILARYLRIDPGRISFRYSEYGKPSLANKTGDGAIRFNHSHSHGIALLGITRRREIGVDLEHVRDEIEYREIAKLFFSRREFSTLESLPREAQIKAFYNCWTRKEAYIKAKGGGLSIPLDRFAVSLRPNEAAALVEVEGDAEETARWSLRELNLGPDYVGSIMVEGHDWKLSCRDWSDVY